MSKTDKEIEKRKLTLEIPKGAPKATKVFSLTKEGREFLERLWEAFPELKPRKDVQTQAKEKTEKEKAAEVD